jgi:hypothetical protein
VYGVGNDFDHAINHVPGAGQALVHQDLTTTGDTYWVQQQINTTGPAGTNVTINDTAPTADRWNLSIVEIVSDNTAAPGLNIDATASRDIGTSGNVAALNAANSVTTFAGNELLVAFISTDAPATGTNTSVQSVTNSGSALTWRRAVQTNVQRGTSEVWWAWAPNAVTGMTVSATLNQAVNATSITVVTFTGATSSYNGAVAWIGHTASANGAQNSGVAPTATLTTSAAGSWVFGVGNDWDTATARTVGPNQVILHQGLVGSDTYWTQSQFNPTPAAGSVTINDTAPLNDRWNLSLVEIVAGP